MLIKTKNPELYRAWIDYFRRVEGIVTYKERTNAFFNSENAIPIPLR